MWPKPMHVGQVRLREGKRCPAVDPVDRHTGTSASPPRASTRGHPRCCTGNRHFQTLRPPRQRRPRSCCRRRRPSGTQGLGAKSLDLPGDCKDRARQGLGRLHRFRRTTTLQLPASCAQLPPDPARRARDQCRGPPLEAILSLFFGY